MLLNNDCLEAMQKLIMGSGSTGIACKDEGFEFIGIEREKEYFEIAEKRINSSSPLMEFM